MDNDYLKHMVGSPFTNGMKNQFNSKIRTNNNSIDEGWTNGPLEHPDYTNVKSAYGRFETSLKSILKSFSDNEQRLRGYTPPPSKQQLSLLNLISDLKKRVIISTNPLQVSPNISEKSNLSGLMKESVWDAFRSELGKAFATKDLNKIIRTYLSQISRAYSNFYSEVTKLTGKDKKFADAVMKMVSPTKIDILKKTDSIARKLNAPKSTVTTPTIPTDGAAQAKAEYDARIDHLKQQSGQAPTVANPPPLPSEPTVAKTPPPTPTPVVAPTTTPSSKPSSSAMSPTPTPSGEESKGTVKWTGTKDDYAEIVLKTMEIVINAVKSDPTGKDYFDKTKKPLPTSWGEEPPEKITELKLSDAIIPSSKPVSVPYGTVENPAVQGSEEVEEIPGNFLYNYASKNRKYPSDSTIEVNPKAEPIELPKGSGNILLIKVIFKTTDQMYDIIALLTNPKTGAKQLIKVFKFYTQEVVPQMGTANNFSVYNLLKATQSPLASEGNPLDGTTEKSSDTVSKINALGGQGLDTEFGRALFRIVKRRFQEFKAKKKSARKLTYNPQTKIVTDSGGGKIQHYTEEDILNLLKTLDPEDAELLRADLNAIGYFKEESDAKKFEIQYNKAKHILINLGVEPGEISKILLKSKEELEKTIKLSAITSDMLIDQGKVMYPNHFKIQLPSLTQNQPASSKPEEKSETPGILAKTIGVAKEEEKDGKPFIVFYPVKGDAVPLTLQTVIHSIVDKPEGTIVKMLIAGGLYKKYKEAADAYLKSKDSPTNEIINPFQRANFLL